MKGRGGALLLVMAVVVVVFAGCGVSVKITEPTDGSKQKQRVIVRGTINNPKAEIYLFVKALPDGQYVLQPSIWVRKEWDGPALLGSTYDPPGGEYEIFALALRKGLGLTPGPVDALPQEYDAKSNVVKVYRAE
jgi:hypothetical protein